MEAIGWRELNLRVDRLRYENLGVSDATLALQYQMGELRRGSIARAIIDHPVVEIELAPFFEAEGEAEKAETAFTFPDPLPLRLLEVNDATLILKEDGHAHEFNLGGRIAAGDRLGADVDLNGEGLSLEGRADLSWPEVTGELNAVARIEAPGVLLDRARRRGWLPVPERIVLRSEALEVEASAELKEATWNVWKLEARSRNVEFSQAKLRASAGRLNFEVQGEGRQVRAMKTQVSQGVLGYQDLVMEWATLQAFAQGTFPDKLEASLKVSGGYLGWSDGAGSLSGLEGTLELPSFQPLATAGRQTLTFRSVEQGDFKSGAGEARLAYQVGGPSGPLELDIVTLALGGEVRIEVNGRLRAPMGLNVRMDLERVELAELAALFPQFEGRVEGRASGELALRLEENRIALLPGRLELEPGAVGRFVYDRQGWLTQDPNLNPEIFVRDREIVAIMKNPKGAQVITELAVRDLNMSKFRLEILTPETKGERAKVRIEGDSMVKGVKVPVVLDVPIRGDLIETIDAVLKFQTKM
jgi:hypothetical protein